MPRRQLSPPLLEALEPRLLLSGADGDLVTAEPIGLDTLGNIQQPIASLSIEFSANVQGSLTAQHLLLHNDTSGADVGADALALAYDPATDVATWSFPGLRGGVLAGARFTARLRAAGIADELGDPLDGDGDGSAGGDLEFLFTVASPGDANLDGWVDRADVLALKEHFGAAAQAWGDGDSDGDGDVDACDYVALKAHCGTRVPSGRPPALATPPAGKYVIDPGGGGLTIGVDGDDPDGDALTITAVSDVPGVSVFIPTGNRYARLRFVQSDGTTAIGEIVVQLFEGRSAAATERFITLATNHVDPDGTLDPGGVPFYTDVPVHRVIDGFMIQTGDAQNGDGTGGSPLGHFPDDFDEVLSFFGRGVLAMANSGPDTNDCQFFLTEVPTTWLDQKHVIFGQIISGWDVLETISELPTDSADRPIDVPLLQHVEILQGAQDATITFLADADFTGDAHVTIALDDGNGNVVEQVITISVQVRIEAPAEVALFPGESTTFTPTIAHTPEGEVDVWTEVSHAELADAVEIDPETHEVTIDVPDDVTVASFQLAIRAMEIGYDNATVVSELVSVLLAGDEPVIAPIDDLFLEPGETVSLLADITDDGPRGLDVSAAASHAGLQADIDPATHELTLTAPSDVTGLFTVTISAVESGFTDRAAATMTFHVFVQAETDPAPLSRLTAQTDMYAESAVRLGQRLYVANGSAGLAIFDVSDPAEPALLGSYPCGDEARDVLVTEAVVDDAQVTVAFVADLFAGVLVLDVTDPAAVTSLGVLPTAGAAIALGLDGSVLYVADWTAGLSIFDVADLRDIRLLGRAKQLTEDLTIGYAVSVSVAEGYAYVADAVYGVYVLDVSDPAHAQYVADFFTYTYPDAYAWDLVVHGGRLHIVTQGNGLIAVDISDPTQPGYLGHLPMALIQWAFLDVSGDLAVISTQNGFLFLDVSDPADMTEVYTFTAPQRGFDPAFFGAQLALPLYEHGIVLLDVSALLAGPA
jgi:peptidyl-prolyl cis-trans isomerase A (cyclophilin A)